MTSVDDLTLVAQSLEEKVTDLQKKIGYDPYRFDGFCVQNILEQGEKEITSGVSNYPNLKSLIERRTELDQYLDPTFCDSFLDSVTKAQLVIDDEDEIRNCILQLKKVNELLLVVNDEVFRNIPDGISDLSHLVRGALDLKKQCSDFKIQLDLLMSKYNSLINYATQKLCRVEISLTTLEIEEDEMKNIDV